jgi:transcriptional regulator with XRE-family HTH domain
MSSLFLTFVRNYFVNSFAKNLKDLRTEAGIGHAELAKQIKVSVGIVSLWENGLREPSMSSLISIARHFKVSIDSLVGIEQFT